MSSSCRICHHTWTDASASTSLGLPSLRILGFQASLPIGDTNQCSVYCKSVLEIKQLRSCLIHRKCHTFTPIDCRILCGSMKRMWQTHCVHDRHAGSTTRPQANKSSSEFSAWFDLTPHYSTLCKKFSYATNYLYLLKLNWDHQFSPIGHQVDTCSLRV